MQFLHKTPSKTCFLLFNYEITLTYNHIQHSNLKTSLNEHHRINFLKLGDFVRGTIIFGVRSYSMSLPQYEAVNTYLEWLFHLHPSQSQIKSSTLLNLFSCLFNKPFSLCWCCFSINKYYFSHCSHELSAYVPSFTN